MLTACVILGKQNSNLKSPIHEIAIAGNLLYSERVRRLRYKTRLYCLGSWIGSPPKRLPVEFSAWLNLRGGSHDFSSFLYQLSLLSTDLILLSSVKCFTQFYRSDTNPSIRKKTVNNLSNHKILSVFKVFLSVSPYSIHALYFTHTLLSWPQNVHFLSCSKLRGVPTLIT